MSRAKLSPDQQANLKFGIIAGITVLGSASLLASLWPLALSTARAQSGQLTREAATAQDGEAYVNYLLAARLNPANQAAYLGLARAQLAANQPDQALRSLEQAGQGSEAQQLKVRTLMELGRYAAAANEAVVLTSSDRSEDDMVLAALSFALADRQSDIAPLISHIASSEALQRVQSAQMGSIPLARQLYATGLLNSSSSLLNKMAPSYEQMLLQATILYAKHTKPDLTAAVELLRRSLVLQPASLEARKLLRQVHTDLGQTEAASQQTDLISRLGTGRP
jgi:tetratricopeptide (TPR) repeat protein